MGKKKRQEEPNMNNDMDSTSSDNTDENQQCALCPHIKKSVDFARIRRVTIQDECDQCKNGKKLPIETMHLDDEIEFDSSLWMCLRCGHQACGRSKNKHALQHFNTPHSDAHCLCLNTSDWRVWCYECQDEVHIIRTKKLLECIEHLRKRTETNRSKVIVHNPSTNMLGGVGETRQITSRSGLPTVRGLTNLGYTCFFNSVMQCLAQTPYLLELLEETAAEGQSFYLPGGKLCVDVDDEKKHIELEPIDGCLEKWKLLNKSLADALRELQSGRADVFNPHILHACLIKRLPQFGGGDQHDSHELLRHLLEAVREEDLKRYQTVILKKIGLTKKSDPMTVEDLDKKQVKFYGQQASELLLPTEQVFRGVLISTLQCEDCKHMSHRNECFLDLSLPISEKQTPPGIRRKAEELDDHKPSKHQLKKERKQAKKNKKSKHHRIATMAPNSTTTTTNSMLKTNGSFEEEEEQVEREEGDEEVEEEDEESRNNSADSESDADIEDNIEENAPSDDGPRKGTESGYNSDKNSPDICVQDNSSPTIGMLNVSPIIGPDSPTSSSETNINMGSPLGGRNTPNDDDIINEEFERPESRLSFAPHKNNNDIKADLEKLSIEEDEDDKMDVEDDEDLWYGTISTCTNIPEGECSVQSCLNQFTTSELMTSNNKVGCDTCTKRHGGGGNKRIVYTNANKQLLIYNPPAVLILHLKRFQVFHFRAAKIQKYVNFPFILDIAPFCSKRSTKLPTFEAGQTKVLYSLYGVVEHSGGMHGGHYVSYVKVRPKLDANSYRWQFLPKNQSKDFSNNRDNNSSGDVPPTGKWYYISDSHTNEVSEERVLSANAYLLFYERIM